MGMFGKKDGKLGTHWCYVSSLYLLVAFGPSRNSFGNVYCRALRASSPGCHGSRGQGRIWHFRFFRACSSCFEPNYVSEI